jgi:hypothetical protein
MANMEGFTKLQEEVLQLVVAESQRALDLAMRASQPLQDQFLEYFVSYFVERFLIQPGPAP